MPSAPRIGFLGAGWIARRRLSSAIYLTIATSSPRIDIVAIADPDPAALAAISDLAPRTRLLTSLDELLSCDLDGIVISTPNYQHSDQACQALDAGVAVFCQKPVGKNSCDTRRVISAAQRADRLLQTDFCYRSLTAAQRIRELVLAGAIGRLFAMDLWFHNSYGPDKTWYYDPARAGGGCLMDLGIHLVDLACWLQGSAAISRGSARLYWRSAPLGAPAVEDFASATLDFATGARVNLLCSWKQPSGGSASIGARLFGASGSLLLSNVAGSFYDFRATHIDQGGNCITLASPPDDWESRSITAWAAALSDSRRFSPSAFDILRVSEALDALYESSLAEGSANGC